MRVETRAEIVAKQVLDYSGAVVGILLLSPVFLVLAILIKLDSPGPVFYHRRVLGRGGKPFDALKFRTMVHNADEVLAADAALKEAFQKDYKLRFDPRV